MTLFTRPLFWLFAQSALLLVLCLFLDAFRVFPMDIDCYYAALCEMEETDLPGVLSNFRTFAYPLFLGFNRWFQEDFDTVPFFQVLIRSLAVFVFYGGLRGIGVKPWLAFFMASPLLYANAVLSHDMYLRVTQIMTDANGESLVIMGIGFLFLLVVQPAARWVWVAYATVLFFAYQTRPAYQFLAVLFPAFGWFVLRTLSPGVEWAPLRRRVVPGLFAVSVLPLLGWCIFRLILVGHFGVVSFVGSSLAGIAGQFLTEEVVADLPEDQQPFAKALVDRRIQLLNKEIPGLYVHHYKEPLHPYTGHLNPGAVDDDDTYLFHQIDLFAEGAKAFFPATKDRNQDKVFQDRKQQELAVAILKARPGMYAQWIWEVFKLAPAKIVWWNVVLSWLVFVLGALAVAWHLHFLSQRLRHGTRVRLHYPAPTACYLWEMNLMLAIGIPLAFCQVGLVAGFVSFLPRYYDTAGIFLIPAAVAGIAEVWARLRVRLFPPADAWSPVPHPELAWPERAEPAPLAN